MTKAVDKIKQSSKDAKNYTELLSSVTKETGSLERIVVKNNQKITIIPSDKINFLEAQDDYVMIYSNLGKYLKKQTMKYYDDNLDGEIFFRVHRSYIVNINAVKQMELFEKESYKITMNDGSKIPVSRSGYSKIKELLK